MLGLEWVGAFYQPAPQGTPTRKERKHMVTKVWVECPHCGTKFTVDNSEIEYICPNCGTEIEEEEWAKEDEDN